MKKTMLSGLALCGCVLCLLLAVGLVYAKFKSSRAAEARAAAALQNSQGLALTETLTGQAGQAQLSARMPPEIGSDSRAAAENRETLDRMSSGPHLTNPMATPTSSRKIDSD